MPIPESVFDALGTENVKTNGGASAYYAAARMSDHTSHQRRMDAIAEDSARLSSLLHGRLGRSVAEPDPTEAISTQKMLSGNDLAQNLAQLLAVINSGQQGVKSAVLTPPVDTGT